MLHFCKNTIEYIRQRQREHENKWKHKTSLPRSLLLRVWFFFYHRCRCRLWWHEWRMKSNKNDIFDNKFIFHNIRFAVFVFVNLICWPFVSMHITASLCLFYISLFISFDVVLHSARRDVTIVWKKEYIRNVDVPRSMSADWLLTTISHYGNLHTSLSLRSKMFNIKYFTFHRRVKYRIRIISNMHIQRQCCMVKRWAHLSAPNMHLSAFDDRELKGRIWKK